MREEIKEKLLLAMLIVFGVLSIYSVCLRAEQIDTKKELSTTPTTMLTDNSN